MHAVIRVPELARLILDKPDYPELDIPSLSLAMRLRCEIILARKNQKDFFPIVVTVENMTNKLWVPVSLRQVTC